MRRDIAHAGRCDGVAIRFCDLVARFDDVAAHLVEPSSEAIKFVALGLGQQVSGHPCLRMSAHDRDGHITEPGLVKRGGDTVRAAGEQRRRWAAFLALIIMRAEPLVPSVPVEDGTRCMRHEHTHLCLPLLERPTDVSMLQCQELVR